MYKLIACLGLLTVVSCNDVIVGLKTDGTKFFDENRQANPAIWRQMDNVTIKAPENEVINRIVITDLRPEKDGDVKIVEGGEGHTNVTIELKSPTVFRGYEFHIEVFSSPDPQAPVDNFNEQSTTENGIQNESKTTEFNIDSAKTTKESSELSTFKNIPISVSIDEQKDNEREGRGVKDGDKTSTEGTTDITSTTPINDMSTTEDVTVRDESVSTNNPKSEGSQSTIHPITLNGNYNNPAIPVLTATDFDNDKEERHARATHNEDSTAEESSDEKLDLTPTIQFHKIETTTVNEKDLSTTEPSSEETTTEEISQLKQADFNFPKVAKEDCKYTSIIPSTPVHVAIPVEEKIDEQQRNVRDAHNEHSHEITSTTMIGENTTLSSKDAETSTSENDKVTIENKPQDSHTDNPINTAKANLGTETQGENQGSYSPRVVPNYRLVNHRFNGPTPPNQDNKTPDDVSVIPAVKGESTISSQKDAGAIGNDFKSSPGNVEGKNYSDNNKTAVKPVISIQ